MILSCSQQWGQPICLVKQSNNCQKIWCSLIALHVFGNSMHSATLQCNTMTGDTMCFTSTCLRFAVFQMTYFSALQANPMLTLQYLSASLWPFLCTNVADRAKCSRNRLATMFLPVGVNFIVHNFSLHFITPQRIWLHCSKVSCLFHAALIFVTFVLSAVIMSNMLYHFSTKCTHPGSAMVQSAAQH